MAQFKEETSIKQYKEIMGKYSKEEIVKAIILINNKYPVRLNRFGKMHLAVIRGYNGDGTISVQTVKGITSRVHPDRVVYMGDDNTKFLTLFAWALRDLREKETNDKH